MTHIASSRSDDHAFFVEPACAAAVAPAYLSAALQKAIYRGKPLGFAPEGENPAESAPVVVIVVCGGLTVTLNQFSTWEKDAAGQALGEVSLFNGMGLDAQL